MASSIDCTTRLFRFKFVDLVRAARRNGGRLHLCLKPWGRHTFWVNEQKGYLSLIETWIYLPRTRTTVRASLFRLEILYKIIPHSLNCANFIIVEEQASVKARNAIKSLCVYYNTEPRGEHLSETEGPELWLDDADSVDLHMDEFLKRCGMRWHKVYGYGEVVRNRLASQARRKRSSEMGSGNDAKRSRAEESSSD